MNSPQRIIIDGYNVIYTDDGLRRIACRDLERARDGLVDRLRSYAAGRRIRLTLVFDGRGGLTDAEILIPGKLQVLFSDAGRTADDVIVDMVSHSGNPRQFVVVTSDAEIGGHLRPLGCDVIGSKRFLDRIAAGGAAREEAGGAETEDEHAPDVGDTDYWLGRFADDADGGVRNED